MTDSNKSIVARTRIVKQDGEYIVKAYNADGERIPDADYFTSDKQDAEDTARIMVETRFTVDGTYK